MAAPSVRKAHGRHFPHDVLGQNLPRSRRDRHSATHFQDVVDASLAHGQAPKREPFSTSSGFSTSSQPKDHQTSHSHLKARL